eukprot:3407163-Amphidinium_carterae.2
MACGVGVACDSGTVWSHLQVEATEKPAGFGREPPNEDRNEATWLPHIVGLHDGCQSSNRKVHATGNSRY